MDRPGHENDRAFYCEAWNGTDAYTYDRIGRGTLHIRAACLSVLGGIQPGPLERYWRDVFGGLGEPAEKRRVETRAVPIPGTERPLSVADWVPGVELVVRLKANKAEFSAPSASPASGKAGR
jgi:Protein of unknown function (DUF3987)